ncbi:MAG: hypothetical protein MUE94_13625 [Verrucomicrobia bacterium]|jgi:hypothetical protein|nr:hypothetical protein [Verrucomicrobiota bacterium]
MPELILSWVVVVVGFAVLVWYLTRRYSPSFWSAQNAIRVVLRSLSLSLIFAPSIFYFGAGLFPAPASMILAFYTFFPDSRDNALLTSSKISIVSLAATWLVFLLASSGSLAWRLSRDRKRAEYAG